MITLESVTKNYGTRRVLNEVSFTVPDGRMTGFVGGNGAGKTTTMRILLGLLSSDGGTVSWNGSAITEEQRRHVGYMPEERGLYPKMKVREQLVYLARLHGMSSAVATAKSNALIDSLGLGERADDAIESLSLGNQQRAQIAASLVHDPVALVLDEPFSGLDPLAVDVVVDVLKERAKAGVPVLFSSHQLDIVERLCDELVIIAGGEIRAAGSRTELLAHNRVLQYELSTTGDLGWIRTEPGIRVIDFDGGRALFDVDSEADAQRVLQRAVASSTVTAFSPVHTSLAQIFREVIR